MDTFCERYNNNRFLIQNQIKAIFDLEPINVESAVKIRNLLDNLFKHLTSLNQLGESIESCSTLIIYFISSKFDKNTAREWERVKTKQNFCSLEDFKTFFIRNKSLSQKRFKSRVQSG